jgi:hypothetical protein
MGPGLTAQIANSSGFQNDAANVTLSTDLRTLTIAPVGAWAKGQQYNFDLQNVIDLSGNPGSIGGPPIGFQVAFDPSTKPPNLLAISPPDGSTAMPLNARIMAAFDKPVYAPFEGVQLTGSDGNTVQLAREYSNDPNEVVFAPVRALRPNTAYSLSFSGATDMSGNPMSSAATAGFVTGETPDYAGPAASLFILTPLPVNLALRIRFSEPISPATVTAQQIQLLAGTVPQPADLLLSADGLSVTVNPRQPLIPGKSYTLSVVAPADFAGNAVTFGGGSFNGVRSTFVAGDSADNTPPAIAIFPADGTSGFPASVNPVFGLAAPSLSVTFSKPVDLMTNPPVLRVLKDGKPLQGAVTTTATQYTFTPSALNYNATYRIEVSNVVDYIGNAAAPASSTFTTSQSAAADTAAFRVTSIQPADGSAVIANDSPIVVVFTKLLNPAGAVFQVRNSSTVPIYGAWTTNGSTMTFTPTEPWPSAATITVNVFRQFGNVAFRDLTNVLLDKDYTFTFTAAVRPDSTPPALVSITPAPGTPISPINNTFTLVFSKPIIVDTQALQAYIGSQTVSVSVFYNQSAHIINATVFSVTADSVLTLIGTGGMHDDAGNSLTPFSFQYPTLKADESGNPNVSSVSPNNYASAAAPNTPIKIQFNKAMDPDSVLAAVRVTQDGAEIAGQLQMLDSNHSVQFTPNANYKAGSRIDVFVFNTAADLSGTRLSQRYQSFFTVAAGEAPETPQMSVSLTSFGDTVAPGAALDLAFDRELDASAAGPENVWLCAGHTRIPGAVVLRNSRTLRFQPSEPLRIGELYVLTTGPNLRSTDGFSNRPREFRFRVDPRSLDVRLESVEYVRAPSSFAVRIRFTGPVSAISADGLKLLAPDGSAVHASARFSTDGREWLLELPAPTAVRVVLDGVEDRWGRKLASESREPVLVR